MSPQPPVGSRGKPRSRPNYNATRRRLRRARGPATARRCGCGAPADHWVYDFTDPNELIDRTTKDFPVAYSLDFSRYVPMCRGCHVRVSGRRRAEALEQEIAALRAILWLVMRPATRVHTPVKHAKVS